MARKKLIHIHSVQQNTEQNGPKLPTADVIEYGEIAVNYLTDNETISFKNSNDEIVQVAMEKECKARYTALKKQLDELAQIYSIYGFARVNGDNSPAGTIFFGDYSNMKELQSHMNMGLMKADGSLYKRCANGRLDLASDGTSLSIDGTDGDVMVFTNAKMYFLKATVDAPTDLNLSDGTQLNIIALGMSPFTIYGVNAKGFNPFALTPQYTVNVTQNGVTAAHSVYNTSYAGQYNAPTAGFNEVFKPNGNGYFSQYVNAMQSIWYAQGKNADQKTNRPFMGGYYEFFEIFTAMMFLELKSVYHQALTSFGCGCTMSNTVGSSTFGDVAMSGNSGVMCSVGGTKYYMGLMSGSAIASTYPVGLLVGGAWYGFTEMLEPIRILNDVAKANLVNKIWDGVTADSANQNVVFTHDDDGNMVVSDLTNTDLANGTNMTPNHKYYQIRNVPNCMGMSDGAMTAVVNIFVKMTFKAGVKVGSATTVDGDFAVYKFSHPVYKGMCLLDGMFKQMQGCHIVKEHTQDSSGSDVYTNRFIYADSYEDLPAQQAQSIVYYGDIDSETDMEKGMNSSVIAGYGINNFWAKDANYNASLFCYLNSGGGINTCESAFTWRDYCWGNGDTAGTTTNGLPKVGRKCVNASVLGCNASAGVVSARSLASYIAVSDSADYYAGAFALAELTL